MLTVAVSDALNAIRFRTDVDMRISEKPDYWGDYLTFEAKTADVAGLTLVEAEAFGTDFGG